MTTAQYLVTPLPTRPATLDDRLDSMNGLLDQVAAGVTALAAEHPETIRRLDAVTAKVSNLAEGISELLTATQRIAARLDDEAGQ